MRKLVSRFYAPKSEDAHLESLADPSNLGDIDENDPKSVARWARKMAAETGEDLGPEFDEMVDRMEAGEMPEEGPEGDVSPDVGDDSGGTDDL